MITTMQHAAREAGKILREYYGKSIASEEKGIKGLVTEVDHKSEETILKILKEKYDFNVYAEESGMSYRESEYCWIIDPIDGTTNYAIGLPLFCISIGLFKNDKPEAAVLYEPLNNEMYWAQKNKGAFLNDKRLLIDKSDYLSVGFDKGYGDYNYQVFMAGMNAVYRVVKEIRTLGSSAIALAMVAKGCLDGFIAYGDELYDVAAGILIAAEAGCEVTNWSGTPWTSSDAGLVVAPQPLNGRLCEVLGEIGKR